MTPRGPSLDVRRWLAGLATFLVFTAYYVAYVAPPNVLGAADPDRYYHLAVSKLVGANGVLASVPQVEDLGWGRYFPDKEYLFHLLTGWASALGGSTLVLWLVPLLGVALMLVLYAEVSRLVPAWKAALVVVAVPLATVAFMFRISILRPHVLAMLVFCLLLIAVLRERPRLAALAATAFALAYHAFYVVALVAALAWVLRNRPGFEGRRTWLWILAGLGAGMLANPYFPTNLGMGLLTLRLALGLDSLPLDGQGLELRALPWPKLLLTYGFVPLTLIATSVATRLRAPGAHLTKLRFLLLVAGAFWLLGIRSPRAMEYAVPACVLAMGYAMVLLPRRSWVIGNIAVLVALQGYVAAPFYREHLRYVSVSGLSDYAPLLAQVPVRPGGYKLFNCEWEVGAYILYERPDLRFVDLLEPTLLWQASREKYMVRRGLVNGQFPEPRSILRGVFDADYVLCSAPSLISQMDATPADFQAAPSTRGDRVRLFVVRPD